MRNDKKPLNFGEKLSDKIAQFGGSWWFIITFVSFIFLWIITNLLLNNPFDVYPFILLNLMLSCLAAVQAPLIMMSQNRQEAKDRKHNQENHALNRKAEKEIRELSKQIKSLHDHLDGIKNKL